MSSMRALLRGVHFSRRLGVRGRECFVRRRFCSAAGRQDTAEFPWREVLALGACGVAGLLWTAWPPRKGTLAGSQPTEEGTLEATLEILQAGTPLGSAGEAASELLFVDLGSGDGRVVSAVVRRFGCRGVGVDVLPESVAEAAAHAAAELPAELADRATFVCADMADVDLASADILFMFLPEMMTRQVVRSLLPSSGLRVGAYVLIEDAPGELRHGYGLRHILHGGVKPTSARNPALELFEWRGAATEERQTPSPFFARSAGAQALLPLVRPAPRTAANAPE